MLKIYCDGACSGNPGPGGWAFIIPKVDVEMSDYEEHTTNNRMEITAVIKALEWVCEHFYDYNQIEDKIEIITDSQYVINTMTKGWARRKNTELWDRLDAAIPKFQSVKWTWVKGHADNKYNERCDQLAVAEYRAYQESQRTIKELEEERELKWYGKKVPLDSLQKIIVEFEPYERYDVGKDHFVNILRCTAIDSVYAAEADSKELLCVGSYSQCRQVLQNYKSLVEDDFRRIPF